MVMGALERQACAEAASLPPCCQKHIDWLLLSLSFPAQPTSRCILRLQSVINGSRFSARQMAKHQDSELVLVKDPEAQLPCAQLIPKYALDSHML